MLIGLWGLLLGDLMGLGFDSCDRGVGCGWFLLLIVVILGFVGISVF